MNVSMKIIFIKRNGGNIRKSKELEEENSSQKNEMLKLKEK